MTRSCRALAPDASVLRVKAVLLTWALLIPHVSGLSTLVALFKQPVRLQFHAPLNLELLAVQPVDEKIKPVNGTERSRQEGPLQDITAPLKGPGIPGASGNKTQSEITGVSMNGDGDTNAMISAFIFSSVGFIVIASLFGVLRKHMPAVYSRDAVAGADPEEEDPAEEGQNRCLAFHRRYTDWFWLVMNTETQEEVRAAGLDGWVLLEFHRLNGRILARLAPVLLALLCPLHYAASPRRMDFISRFDVANLPDGSGLWWVHAALVWFVVMVSTMSIRSSHQDFLERRFQWLRELPAPQVKTIMVENIPEEYRSDRALSEYFQRIFGQGSVERAYLVRRAKELRDMVGQFDLQKYKLVLAEKTWQKAGSPSDGEGLLDMLRSELRRLSKNVMMERSMMEDVCKGGSEEKYAGPVLSICSAKGEELRKKYCAPSGFVTFTDQLTHRLALGQQYRKDITEVSVCQAPDPSDIIYDDLEEEVSAGSSREIVGRLWLTFIFVSWSPIIVFISSITTLGTIEAYVPFVRNWCTKSPNLASFLEGVLATAALKLFLAFLPSILLGIIRRFFLLKSGAWAQVRLERWYFSFLTIFVLLVTVLGRSLIITTAILVQKPASIIELLAQSLPGASHFYFNYFILGWLSHAWDMIRFVQLAKYWFYRVAYQLPIETAKEYCEPEDAANHGMGTRLAFSALMAAITFVFCSCSPLITIFAAIYFGSARIVYGYLLVRAETKKPDLGGQFWIEALKQVFFALTVYVFLMTGVLAAHGGLEHHSFWHRFGPAILSGCALLALLWQWRRVNDHAWDLLPLQVLAEDPPQASVETRGEKGDYMQPECASSVSAD